MNEQGVKVKIKLFSTILPTEGEKEAYFKYDFDDNIDQPDNIDAYDLYVHVYLEEPLVIECN